MKTKNFAKVFAVLSALLMIFVLVYFVIFPENFKMTHKLIYVFLIALVALFVSLRRTKRRRWEDLSFEERFQLSAQQLKTGQRTWFILLSNNSPDEMHALPLSKKELYDRANSGNLCKQSTTTEVKELLYAGKIKNPMAVGQIFEYYNQN